MATEWLCVLSGSFCGTGMGVSSEVLAIEWLSVLLSSFCGHATGYTDRVGHDIGGVILYFISLSRKGGFIYARSFVAGFGPYSWKMLTRKG